MTELRFLRKEDKSRSHKERHCRIVNCWNRSVLLLCLVLGALLLPWQAVSVKADIKDEIKGFLASGTYTEEQKQRAKDWLRSHGYAPTRDGAYQAYYDWLDGKWWEEMGAPSYYFDTEEEEESEKPTAATQKSQRESEEAASEPTEPSAEESNERAVEPATQKAQEPATQKAQEPVAPAVQKHWAISENKPLLRRLVRGLAAVNATLAHWLAFCLH